MKTLRTWTLSLAGAALTLLLFVNTPGLAARGKITLLDGVTATGSSALIFADGEEPGSSYVFGFHATGAGAGKVEVSLDRVNWSTAITFAGTDDVKSLPVCGACWIRATATTASAGNAVTVLASLSGSKMVVFAPTLTPTRTPTLTPTVTPTHI